MTRYNLLKSILVEEIEKRDTLEEMINNTNLDRTGYLAKLNALKKECQDKITALAIDMGRILENKDFQSKLNIPFLLEHLSFKDQMFMIHQCASYGLTKEIEIIQNYLLIEKPNLKSITDECAKAIELGNEFKQRITTLIYNERLDPHVQLFLAVMPVVIYQRLIDNFKMSYGDSVELTELEEVYRKYLKIKEVENA